MANKNCLEGYRCPKCKSEGPFRIVGTSEFTVWDDGTEDHSDVQWDDDSTCVCTQCDFGGTLGDFAIKAPPAKGKLWWFYDTHELPELQEIYEADGVVTELYPNKGQDGSFCVIFEIDRQAAVDKGWAASVDSEEWLDEEEEE